ncbi:hypothetical protein CLOM_g23822 [Closterium sp. NIES-68]|nr:hypothetical protein CLOM_g23822 [Closterium sp. NIES-68]GJP71991.1 hypothetical protein CLOP_g2769 [Closterium sp. NIES-67]
MATAGVSSLPHSSSPIPGGSGSGSGSGDESRDGRESSGTVPSSSGAPSSDGNFECNICFETANDPVITLCGHLFCWACLYRWLRRNPHNKECPVCKAAVDEAKVIPLYGRGKAPSDPRKKPVPDVDDDIPNRPAGQRTESVRNPNGNGAAAGGGGWGYNHPGMGFFAGAGGPFATAQFGGFTVSAGFGLFPALFGLQLHGFPGQEGVPGAGGAGGGPTGGGLNQAGNLQQQNLNPVELQQQAFLSRLLLMLGLFVLMTLFLV